ncbi:Voltage-dependent potassium channel domain-containing protein [Rozella allomycis CSF55]|uniref:Voltage-dependent potassium channel domain-containing protein n=1 Tax=Rozella allomycis (strain CSF55) TaxID=988480 RepID=A0A075B268_ROZAC|nr:Voltage-dependent potassium channel domain-containing protein [Rozella allomycis CSF55]|eukprot:EPZ35061.1 Voltage-dependent potassium channel domain-containing protein [Rozella allomycis CSF55]
MGSEKIPSGNAEYQKVGVGNENGSSEFLSYRKSYKARIYKFLTQVYTILLIVASVIIMFLDTLTKLHYLNNVFTIIETIIAIHFMIEYILKCSTSYDKRAFAVSMSGIIDLLSFLPHLIDLLFQLGPFDFRGIQILRLFRALRLLKIVGSVKDVNIFIVAIKRSRPACIVFSAAIYYAETAVCVFDKVNDQWIYGQSMGEFQGKRSQIQNIADATWYTIGYGDVVPKAPLSRIISFLIIISGMLFLGLPVTVFSSNLTELYLEHRFQQQARKREMHQKHYEMKKTAFQEISRDSIVSERASPFLSSHASDQKDLMIQIEPELLNKNGVPIVSTFEMIAEINRELTFELELMKRQFNKINESQKILTNYVLTLARQVGMEDETIHDLHLDNNLENFCQTCSDSYHTQVENNKE